MPNKKYLDKESAELFDTIKRDYNIQDKQRLLLLQTALEAFTEMRQAQAEMNGEPTYKDQSGQVREKPSAKIVRASRGQFISILKELDLKAMDAYFPAW